MNGKTRLGLIFISLGMIFLAGVFFIIAKDQYSRREITIPAGSTIGEFPSGTDIEETLRQIRAIYDVPVEMKYNESIIQVAPSELGFSIDLENAGAAFQTAMDALRNGNDLKEMFFGKDTAPESIHVEIRMNVDPEAIRDYLEKTISPRYDQPAISRQPAVDGSGFYPGHAGYELDIETAVPLIREALLSSSERTVTLPVKDIPEPAGNLDNLAVLLKSVIDTWQDKGQITEVWLSDPETKQSFDIARRDKTDLVPEVSFTAASTMKLPIMISSYARMDEEPNALTKEQLRLMITESKNDQTDWMMENIVGGERAPLIVTEDMEKFGMKNSFLAGYFYLGAPLLALYETEANQRTDINLHPDVYNQTTAKDMGTLMEALYYCDRDDTGFLKDIYGEEITQQECNAMIQLLKDNHLPYLISAGVPDNVEVAHKHGWIEENDGLLHTMGNIASVYSPGGAYILSIYTYHPENLIFDEGSTLFSRISAAAYEYFNPSLEPKTGD